MLLKSILITVSILLCSNIYGQNLVPNGSFEEIKGQENGAGVSSIKYWFVPTPGTTDYYRINKWNKINDFGEMGQMLPKDGKAFVGVVVAAPGSLYNRNSKEYIETKLITPLQPHKKYCVRMYIVLGPNNKYATDGVGITYPKRR